MSRDSELDKGRPLHRRECVERIRDRWWRSSREGGTALHKVFVSPAGRYSEDIDLVQAEAGPIGPLLGGLREALDPWLGTPRWKQGLGRVTVTYRFDTSFEPVIRMRLKVEINTREHFNVQGMGVRRFVVERQTR
ncbi:MAG: nucleotidyl transferase AbiEii/AbiGii toxin family protein [Gemmatimonadota bacterium]